MSGVNVPISDPTPKEWSIAYAKQARADFAARETLCRDQTLSRSQQLHFLQMACEKLAKAHLCRSGTDPADLQTSHAYVAKNIPLVVGIQFATTNDRELAKKSWMMAHIRHFSREIELLAPAVDANGQRNDNCEYPWIDGSGKLVIPAEHEFANLNFLQEPVGSHFLKLLMIATGSMLDS